MIFRTLAFAGGLAGAAGLSQFPEYSQQYTQRLAGAVEELSQFVADFDRDADGVGLTRAEALVQLAQGGAIGAARANTVATTIARHERLSAFYRKIVSAGPFSRAWHVRSLADAELARGTIRDYRPALPLTFEGIVFGGAGFLLGGLLSSAFLSVLGFAFRRRRPA